jgi:hypothetical protein
MRKLIAFGMVGIVSLLITGCAALAPPPPQKWVSIKVNYDDFSQSKYTCMKESAMPPTYNPVTLHTDTTNDDLFMACMGAHGWRWQ